MGVRSLNLNLMMIHLLKLFPKSHAFGSQSDLAFVLEKVMKGERDPKFYDALSGIFLRYGLYGGKLERWQEELYNQLKEHFTFPIDVFDHIAPLKEGEKKIEIHIFGMAHVPPIYFDYLLQCSPYVNIHLYQLTFSNRYWGDLLSSRQKVYLTKQEGAEPLEEYLSCQNPLFSNLCRHGQSHLIKLVDTGLPLFDDDEEPQFEPTLLGALQSDLFHLDEPQLEKNEKDETIQLYQAPSMSCEVENIYNVLCRYIDQTGANPSHISVLAPNIDQYAPYIEYIFGKEESHLGYQIEGVSSTMKDESYKLINLILNLVESRWEKGELLELLESPIVQRKLMIEVSEVALIKSWFERTKFMWGYDSDHRNEFIREGSNERGTLRHTFHQLLSSLSFANSVSSSFTVELTLAPLVEKVIAFFQSLYEGLTQIKRAKLSLKEWYAQLWQFFSQFIDDSDGFNAFISKLRTLFQIESVTQEAVYSFESIEPHLRLILSAKRGVLRDYSKPMVRFASIQLGETFGSECVVLMGLNQGDFPRYTQPLSFEMEPKGYLPQQNHIDRYFFLELLSSVQRFLILSYRNDPSLCILDLQAHLRRRFGVDLEAKKVSDLPFVADHIEQSYLPSNYTYAASFEGEKGRRAPLFVKETTLSDREVVIDIDVLKKIVRNPYQYVANHHLNVFHRQMEEDERWLKEFVLTNFDKALLRFASLNQPYTKLVEQLRHQSQISSDLFEKVAQIDIKSEYDAIHAAIEKWGVSFDQIFSVHLTPFAKEVRKVNGSLYEHPPIVIELEEGIRVKIVGQIDHLVKEGMLAIARGRFEDYFKLWPLVLIARHLNIEFNEPFLLYTLRDGRRREVPFDTDLRPFLSYALRVKERMTPLHPALAEPLLLKGEKEYQKGAKTIFSEYSIMHEEPYMRWVFHSHHELIDHVDFEHFQKSMQSYFSNLVSWVRK